ncbi:MAG: GMC oxidoreductase [Acidimicrobiia bacterium]|nr:GMC oxidoreductase [Acidimicrobiia bacterium]
MSAIWKSISESAPAERRAEVVVIGSGATGQSVAKRLAERNVDVLMVEAGPATETHRKSQELLQASMPAVHGQYPDFGSHMLMNLGGSIGKPQMAMSADGSAPAEGIRLAKLTEADLADWPIERSDLDPYYDLVSSWFGIRWDQYPLPEFDDSRLRAARFQVVSRRLFSHPTAEHLEGIRVLLDAPVNKLESDATGRIRRATVTTMSGEAFVLEADVFVLAMNTMPATQLLLHSAVANESGLLGRHLMDHPLVTFGYVEPAKDLPRSILDPLTPTPIDTGLWWPKLIPDQHAVANDEGVNLALTMFPLNWTVRRNLFRHRMLKPVVVGARTGAKHSFDRAVDATKNKRFDKSLVKDIMQSARGIDELAHIKLRSKGPEFNLESGWWKETLDSSLPETFELIGMAQQRSHHENHVTLSDERNALGWRKLRVNWRYSTEDKLLVDQAAQPIIAALDDAGFGRITLIDPMKHTENYSCHHASGTIRMAKDPTRGVVNEHCQTHEHSNLYVAGMSVFPSVGYANPTLTGMALGARIADHIGSR